MVCKAVMGQYAFVDMRKLKVVFNDGEPDRRMVIAEQRNGGARQPRLFIGLG